MRNAVQCRPLKVNAMIEHDRTVGHQLKAFGLDSAKDCFEGQACLYGLLLKNGVTSVVWKLSGPTWSRYLMLLRDKPSQPDTSPVVMFILFLVA